MFYDSTVEVPIKCHAWPVAADFFSYFLILASSLYEQSATPQAVFIPDVIWHSWAVRGFVCLSTIPEHEDHLLKPFCSDIFGCWSSPWLRHGGEQLPKAGMAWWRLHVLFVNNDCLMCLMFLRCKWVPAVDVLDLCQRGIGTSYKSMKCLPAIPCHWITTPRLHSATQDRVWSPQFISKHGRKTG